MRNSENTIIIISQKLNQNNIECIQKINELCGGSNKISDTILEFDNIRYKTYEQQREMLIRGICDVVKITFKTPDFEQFRKQLPDTEFWDRIKEIVEKRTTGYLNAVSYNKLEKDERIKLLSNCFESVFIERENSDYIVEQLGDEILAKTLYGVMIESEYAIVTLYVSKRRFMMGMKESYGLAEDDTKYIWDIFERNHETVERHEFHRRMFLMTRRMDEINKKVDEMQDDLDTLIFLYNNDD